MWKAFVEWITFKSFRMKRARDRYELLKRAISYRHFNGFAGLVINRDIVVQGEGGIPDFIDGSRKFTKKDFECFKAPMYFWTKNQDGFWCVFWDRGRLTREIGTGAPLREGELMIDDPAGRTKPSSTLETIDEQRPLVVAPGPNQAVQP